MAKQSGPRAGGTRLALSVRSGDRQVAVVERPFTAQLRVRLADSAGRPAGGRRVAFRVVSGPARFGRGATAATAVTGTGGVAIAPVLAALGRPGAVTVTATVPGSADIRPVSFVLRVIPWR